MASHELRTPITSIKALAQLLERKSERLQNQEIVNGRKLYQQGEELILLKFEDVTEKRLLDRQKEDFIW